MADTKTYGLSITQVQRLARIADAVESSELSLLGQGSRRNLIAARVMIGLLTDAITATTGLATKPKVGTLNVYSFTSTGTEDTGIDLTVYNFAPQAATTDRWSVAERDNWTGKWILTTQFCS